MDQIGRLGAANYRNAARNLHKFVHREGKTLPIPISTAPLTIRKKGGGCVDVNYPILRLTDWMEFILGKAGGQFLLAGYHVWETGYEDVFSRFWERFRPSNATHDIYSKKTAAERARTIPLCIHGDEGRGLAKVPVLVTNFQCVVPWLGENHLNTHGLLRGMLIKEFLDLCFSVLVHQQSSVEHSLEHQRHSFCTRLLHSIMPASCYAPNDKTIDGLHEAIAAEFVELFERGVTIQVPKLMT